ncbi:MAG: DHH family phosphoesterase [Promethearchaeota archaeon]
MTNEDFFKAIDQARDYVLNEIAEPRSPKEELTKGSKKEGENQEPDLSKFPDSQYSPLTFRKNIHIYSHLDADGLSAAAILGKVFERKEIGYQITILRQLEIQYIQKIAEEQTKSNRFIIFSDFGTGQLNFIKENLQSNNYLILDHHKPEDISLEPSVNHINPYFYDVKGEDEISGAGVCYLFGKSMDPENIDLASIAIVGAIGDMQNNQEKGAFHGLNTLILEDAVKSGKVEVDFNLAISRTKPLPNAIAYSLPIKIPNLSNNVLHVEEFLRLNQIRFTNEIEEPRAFLDLSDLEKKTLLNALLKFAIVEAGLAPKVGKQLVANIYILKDYDEKHRISDAREMSGLLNACGRSDNSALGIAALLGDERSLKFAIENTRAYKRNIYLSINKAKERIRDYDNIRTVYEQSIDEKMIGTICSILVHSEEYLNKPLIGFADSDNHTLKVSSRADKTLIEEGLDLGVVMRSACQKLGIINPAGGHPPAAGAKIPADKLGNFIKEVDKIVASQIKIQ